MDTPSYRATVGDRSFDLSFEEDHVVIDGTPTPYSVEVLRDGSLSLILDGRSVPVAVEPLGDGRLKVTISGRRTVVRVQDERDLLVDEYGLAADEGGGGAVRAPMPGLVLDILVEEGETVEAEQGLLVLEAMKMENELTAPSGGVVETIHVESGASVDKEALLIDIAPA
jgi:pyruvate carboxylase subunit B